MSNFDLLRNNYSFSVDREWKQVNEQKIGMFLRSSIKIFWSKMFTAKKRLQYDFIWIFSYNACIPDLSYTT